MKQEELIHLGKEFAKFFVYCCEGEQYTSMIDEFRWAKNRLTLVESISTLLQFGKTATPINTKEISSEKCKRLTEFIQNGEFQAVKDLHTTMIRYVSAYELEKIRETEQYLTELLVQFDHGDNK